MAAGGTASTFLVTANISSTATSNLVNTASATDPAGTSDPNNTNNSATDTDTAQVKSMISGTVYVDVNNNGLRDPGELPIPGVTVQLTGTTTTGVPVSASVVTDAAGGFDFLGLALGTYNLHEVQPTNFIDGKDTGRLAGGRGDKRHDFQHCVRPGEGWRRLSFRGTGADARGHLQADANCLLNRLPARTRNTRIGRGIAL